MTSETPNPDASNDPADQSGFSTVPDQDGNSEKTAPEETAPGGATTDEPGEQPAPDGGTAGQEG